MTDISTRRKFLFRLTAGGAAAGILSGLGRAACPDFRGPIRWIVPNAAGGGYDSISRLLEPHLRRTLGARIQVDNVAGAGGLRGATALSEAKPDGSVLGIVNLPGLLTTLAGDAKSLNPIERLTLLGTVATSRHVWSTGPSGNLTSLEDVLKIGRTKGLVFAMNSFTSLGFLTAAIPCAVLGLNAEFVSGYSGSGESMMAAIRGEVDIVSLDRETQLDRVAAGDLRPLFRIAGDDAGWNRPYADLPKLAGSQGLIADRSAEDRENAEALVRLTDSGRAIAAPPGLPVELARCIAEAVCATLRDPELARQASAANLTLDSACAAETLARARSAQADLERLGPLLRAAIAKVRA